MNAKTDRSVELLRELVRATAEVNEHRATPPGRRDQDAVCCALGGQARAFRAARRFVDDLDSKGAVASAEKATK